MLKEQLDEIRRLHAIVERNLFQINPTLCYRGVLETIGKLADCVHVFASDSDSDTLWSIGECGAASLDSMIVGAYWFCTDYSGGQTSLEYLTQCQLGQVFSPGMTSGCEPDSSELEVYEMLELRFKETQK